LNADLHRVFQVVNSLGYVVDAIPDGAGKQLSLGRSLSQEL